MDPEMLKYTEEHLWLHVKGNLAICGISDFAQQELGDLVYVELPTPGDEVETGDIICTIESVKSTNDIACPFSGEIVEVNESLADNPEMVNREPYGEGWIFSIRFTDSDEITDLMDYTAYFKFVDSE